jgi:hypothetical protein
LPVAKSDPPVSLTSPETALVRRPTLSSPVTVILPVLVIDPESALSIAIPAELLPSTVIVQLLAILPV